MENDDNLYLIMEAVQALVDEACPPDEDGNHTYTPAILKKMRAVQSAICEALDVPERPLIAPGD